MNYARMPGPGDSQTWPQCSGHPLDPRVDDDIDDIDAVDPLEVAEEEFLATPAFVAEWLDGECRGHVDPVATYALGERCTSDITVPQLVAMMFATHDAEALRALHELRERFVRDNQPGLKDRAGEIERERSGL